MLPEILRDLEQLNAKEEEDRRALEIRKKGASPKR
jgi:hypothetical protein